jgi:hypothetical protein
MNSPIVFNFKSTSQGSKIYQLSLNVHFSVVELKIKFQPKIIILSISLNLYLTSGILLNIYLVR